MRKIIKWNTSDERLNESLDASLFDVSESKYGLYLFGSRVWLRSEKSNEIVNIYIHVRRKLSINNLDIKMLCGDTMRAYAISDVAPLNGYMDGDSTICSECLSHAELIMFAE